jgi:2-hydroxychromene-2-carboxylate isomerase
LFAITAALGLSAENLRDALAAKRFAGKIRADFMGGVRSGVNGTPTFFIGNERHDGTYHYDDLVMSIEAHLEMGALV